MTNLIERAEAERIAEDVAKHHGFTALPICPFTIAQKADIVVQEKESNAPGVSGFLMRVGDTFGIQYAHHIKNEGFIRFTIAHELGHYFLPGHPDKLFPTGHGLHHSRSGFISDDPLERQADHFAGALLMPASLFKKAMNRAGQGFAAIDLLAKQCKTSITATAIRYAQFTWDTVAVIVSSENRVEYCFLSEQLKNLRGLTWLKKGDIIPPSSTTAAFNRTPSNIAKAKKEEGSCNLDEWLDGAPDIEINEDVIGLGTYGKTLTVLFTDEALEAEDESEEEEDELPSQRWKFR